MWFTSDLHLNHENILKYCPERGNLWSSVNEMNQSIIDRWNSVVKPKQLIYCLGDICFYNTDILNKLNGKIILIKGNHDRKEIINCGRFEAVVPYLEIKLDKKLITMCHYKMEVWRNSHYNNSYHLYGHSHGTREGDSQCCDVGIDNPFTNFTPVSFPQILEFLKTQELRNEREI